MKFFSYHLRHPRHPCVITLFAMGIIAGTYAQPVGESLRVQDAVRIARSQNPELRAAAYLLDEAKHRAGMTGRLSNPEIESEVAGGAEFEGRVSLGVTQRFPLTSRLRHERAVSAIDIQIAEWEVRERMQQLTTATRIAFYELVAAREAIQLATRDVTWADALAKEIQIAAGSGFQSALDADQAKISAELMRTRIESLNADAIMVLGRLVHLLGIAPDAKISLRESFQPPAAVPSVQSPGIRPDVRLAELLVESGDARLTLARATRWDDLGVGVFVEGERFADEPEGIQPEALLGLKFSIPLPLWQDGRAAIEEKLGSAERARAQLAAVRLSAENETTFAHRAMAIRHESAMRTQSTLVPAAKKHLADTEAAYRRGESSIQSVFQVREQLIEIEAAALESRKQYFLSYAAWLAALGESSIP